MVAGTLARFISTVKLLVDAEPEAKAALYVDLGVRLTYDFTRKIVAGEPQPAPWALERVGGGNRTIDPRRSGRRR
jgi:hypothetical protein